MNTVDKDTFIEENMGLVGMVIREFRNRIKSYSHVDWEDLRQIGTIGLMKAYDRFDPNFGTQFSTYAVPMIRGEVQRFVRDNLDTVKFSRGIKANYYKIIKANLLEESPGIISSILDIPIHHVEDALAYYRGQYPDSLERPVFEDDGAPLLLGDIIGDETDFDSNIIIEDFLRQFEGTTREVMRLRLQNLSQKEIGKTLKTSQPQISRILLAARKQLEEGGLSMSNNKKRNFNLAKKLAIETELNPSQISKQTGISYTTAYNYVRNYRPTKEKIEEVERKINKEESPVKTYKLSPEELDKYRENDPVTKAINHKPEPETKETVEETEAKEPVVKVEKPIKDEPIVEHEPIAITTENLNQETSNSYGHMAMTFNLTAGDATSQLEEVIRAMNILGFDNLEITIQSKKVA